MISNKQTYEELTNVANINTSLEGKLTEVTSLKDTALQTLETKTQEFQGLTGEVSTLKDDIIGRDHKIDDLYDVIRRLKLGEGEVIEKIVVK